MDDVGRIFADAGALEAAGRVWTGPAVVFVMPTARPSSLAAARWTLQGLMLPYLNNHSRQIDLHQLGEQTPPKKHRLSPQEGILSGRKAAASEETLHVICDIRIKDPPTPPPPDSTSCTCTEMTFWPRRTIW